MKNSILGRRSVRFYQDKRVPKELIDHILYHALWAPSSHNRQPWRFAILEKSIEKEKLASHMKEKLHLDRLKDGDPLHLIEADTARSFKRITNAPLVIVVFLTMEEMDQYPDEKRRKAEYLMAVQSTAMAVQNILLSAYQEGLGSCWMCAPLFCPDLVVDVLGVPLDWQPQALITIGYPKDQGKAKPRKDLSDVVWREGICS